jgi:hypothetical protein
MQIPASPVTATIAREMNRMQDGQQYNRKARQTSEARQSGPPCFASGLGVHNRLINLSTHEPLSLSHETPSFWAQGVGSAWTRAWLLQMREEGELGYARALVQSSLSANGTSSKGYTTVVNSSKTRAFATITSIPPP